MHGVGMHPVRFRPTGHGGGHTGNIVCGLQNSSISSDGDALVVHDATCKFPLAIAIDAFCDVQAKYADAESCSARNPKHCCHWQARFRSDA